MYYGEFKLFGEKEVSSYFDEIKKEINKEIEKIKEDTILNTDLKLMTEDFYKKYYINNLEFDFQNVKKSAQEKKIESRELPTSYRFDRDPCKTYMILVANYNIPFKGNPTLLKLIPSKRILWAINCYINNNYLNFEILSYSRNAEEVKNEYDSIVANIQKQNNYLKSNINHFNSNDLKIFITDTLSNRKKRIEEKNKFLESI